SSSRCGAAANCIAAKSPCATTQSFSSPVTSFVGLSIQRYGSETSIPNWLSTTSTVFAVGGPMGGAIGDAASASGGVTLGVGVGRIGFVGAGVGEGGQHAVISASK